MYAKSYPKKYLKPDHKEKYKTKLDLNSNLEIKKKNDLTLAFESQVSLLNIHVCDELP